MERVREAHGKQGKQECDRGRGGEKIEEHTAGDRGDEVCFHSV